MAKRKEGGVCVVEETIFIPFDLLLFKLSWDKVDIVNHK